MSIFFSPFRSKTTTLVPSAFSRSTIAAPIPAAPPVTIAVLPFKPRISILLWNDRGRLELDLTRRVEEVRYENHAHRRIVIAHEAPPDPAELGPRREVGLLVAAIGREAADVLRPAARFGEHGEDIFKGLLKLSGNVFRLEALLGIPADLAGDEHQAPGGGDAVGIADRRFPAARQQDAHR